MAEKQEDTSKTNTPSPDDRAERVEKYTEGETLPTISVSIPMPEVRPPKPETASTGTPPKDAGTRQEESP